jgi:steroid delta-isomerase-like uncharacterized protein
MLSQRERLSILRKHAELENAHRLEETLETLTQDCVFEDIALGERTAGRAAAAAYYERWWRGFPDLTWSTVALHMAEDEAIAEGIFRGTHQGEFLGLAPTGRKIELPVAIVVAFADGRMARERLYYDLATLLRQLGVSRLPSGVNAP